MVDSAYQEYVSKSKTGEDVKLPQEPAMTQFKSKDRLTKKVTCKKNNCLTEL